MLGFLVLSSLLFLSDIHIWLNCAEISNGKHLRIARIFFLLWDYWLCGTSKAFRCLMDVLIWLSSFYFSVVLHSFYVYYNLFIILSTHCQVWTLWRANFLGVKVPMCIKFLGINCECASNFKSFPFFIFNVARTAWKLGWPTCYGL